MRNVQFQLPCAAQKRLIIIIIIVITIVVISKHAFLDDLSLSYRVCINKNLRIHAEINTIYSYGFENDS